MTNHMMRVMAGWLIIIAVVAGLIAPHVSGVMWIGCAAVYYIACGLSTIVSLVAIIQRKY